jgi:hypothetical protein
LPANGSASRANTLTARHHCADGTESAPHAVM